MAVCYFEQAADSLHGDAATLTRDGYVSQSSRTYIRRVYCKLVGGKLWNTQRIDDSGSVDCLVMPWLHHWLSQPSLEAPRAEKGWPVGGHEKKKRKVYAAVSVDLLAVPSERVDKSQ